jgi:hypothetical protein
VGVFQIMVFVIYLGRSYRLMVWWYHSTIGDASAKQETSPEALSFALVTTEKSRPPHLAPDTYLDHIVSVNVSLTFYIIMFVYRKDKAPVLHCPPGEGRGGHDTFAKKEKKR